MNRLKQKVKIKEPVRLRTKKLANGNLSLYLDTYQKGRRSYEFLRLYLIPERTPEDRAINQATIKAATAIKARRILDIISEKARIKTRSADMYLQEWIAQIIEIRQDRRSKSSIRLMHRLLRHIDRFRPCTRLTDIDHNFCIAFVAYLGSARSLISDKPLQATTQLELLNALSFILNEAVRAELIVSNPMHLLSPSDRIRKAESTREYLTPKEVMRIIGLSCNNIAAGDDIAAFLFCCFCGLRYSDVAVLKWSDIKESPDGKVITVSMKKTKRQITVPLSRQACSMLPPAGASDEHVFKVPAYGVTLRRLKKIASSAGIKKNVTFHVSRHTFATMMLTAGVDLYTISKLIGHADIRTTQIYSKVVDKKKREAVVLLDSLF